MLLQQGYAMHDRSRSISRQNHQSRPSNVSNPRNARVSRMETELNNSQMREPLLDHTVHRDNFTMDGDSRYYHPNNQDRFNNIDSFFSQDRSFYNFRSNEQQTREERESIISYVKVNLFFSIIILFITVLEGKSLCTNEIHSWLIIYATLVILDSISKVASLRRNIMGWKVKLFFKIYELVIDFIQVGWLIYGNVIFLHESKYCIQNSPVLTYTLLFVLIIGFIELAKFAFLIICLVIWFIAKCFGAQLTLSQILGDYDTA